jgi:nucleoside 2-deoxyribosyltransferase
LIEMKLPVYVASALFQWERVLAIQEKLAAHKVAVTFDWALRYRDRVAAGREEDKAEVAFLEVQAVQRASCLLLVAPGKRGAHVEFGVALGMRKPAVVLLEDPSEDISFYHHPGVTVLRTEAEAIAEVVRHATVSVGPDAEPKLRVCFDVDGVLCDDSDPKVPYARRPPYPFARECLQRLRACGHTIVLQTARYMGKCDGDQQKAREAGLLELRTWCRDNDIPHDEIYFGKAAAHVYFDDRGGRVESNKGPSDWVATVPKLLHHEALRHAQTHAAVLASEGRAA